MPVIWPIISEIAALSKVPWPCNIYLLAGHPATQFPVSLVGTVPDCLLYLLHGSQFLICKKDK